MVPCVAGRGWLQAAHDCRGLKSYKKSLTKLTSEKALRGSQSTLLAGEAREGRQLHEGAFRRALAAISQPRLFKIKLCENLVLLTLGCCSEA